MTGPYEFTDLVVIVGGQEIHCNVAEDLDALGLEAQINQALGEAYSRVCVMVVPPGQMRVFDDLLASSLESAVAVRRQALVPVASSAERDDRRRQRDVMLGLGHRPKRSRRRR